MMEGWILMDDRYAERGGLRQNTKKIVVCTICIILIVLLV